MLEIQEILESLKAGKTSVNNAKKLLSLYSIEEVEGFAKIDIDRRRRRGIPEVIFAETKKLDEIRKIIEKTLEKIKSLNAEILFPKTAAGEYGYVAEFKDSEGNRVALFESK